MSKIRTSIFASVFGLLLLPTVVLAQDAGLTSAYQAYGWQIDAFDAVIEVHEDASLTVEETIETQFNSSFFKHGIIREIPVVYLDDLGNRVKIDLDIQSVLQNGESANYTVSRSGSDLNVKIGDANVVVSGPITYEITYTVDRAILYFDESDEVYWNVTGTEWEVPIEDATAVVILPEGTEPVNTACYTGYFGSTTQDCGIATEDHYAAFAANDFLTVAVSFPKETVYEPTALERFGYFLMDNWIGFIPLLLIMGMFVVWFIYGRDPRMRTIIAEFEPPEGVQAVYAGYLTKNHITSQLYAAMIIQLAVQGYLSIQAEEEKKGLLGIKSRKITLKREKTSEGLDETHRLLFEGIFGSRNPKQEATLAQIRSSMSKKSTLTRIRSAIKQRIKDEGWYAKHSLALRTTMFVLVTGPLFYATFAAGAFFGVFAGIMFMIAAIVSVLFAFLMPKRTPKGTEMARHVLGFKLFMHTAERYRSKWHEEQNMFTEYLPYAIAFNQVQKWADTFKDLEYSQPSWYTTNAAILSTADFARDLNFTTTSLRGAVGPQSSPSSSGSSGGGFSGGGFGGGGGSSW